HPHPEFDLRTETYKLLGVDVTQIPGIAENALPLFSEVGRDMSPWPSAIHSWRIIQYKGTASLRPSLPWRSSVPAAKPEGPGLFCIGEVVDETGQLGGFNFQWAWASGVCAGHAL
ncbi:MAG TPA: NAD(P)/FAD-dependent oxidoreductase, partial [Terriglobales bacterium]|nr:NAD(P)/FAD-dependent oxidoreductase [Terriglobales bacterium]